MFKALYLVATLAVFYITLELGYDAYQMWVEFGVFSFTSAVTMMIALGAGATLYSAAKYWELCHA